MSSCNPSEKPENIRAESMLAASLRGGRLSHAILVEGMRGAIDFAKRIAGALVCESDADKPCGKCKQCMKALKGIHPDILIYSGGERSRSFHIDTVRELRQEAYLRPNDAAAKVMILENVQNMTVQAQNALLKIIEEPPGVVTFILTCENKAVLLETILSRVSVFSLDEAVLSGTEPESSIFPEKAREIIENLLSGSELQALAAFSYYEKDRVGLGSLFSEIRGQAAANLVEMAKSGHNDREKSKKLYKIIKVIDDIEAGIAQNVGGLLMSVILPAKFKAT